VAQRFWGSIEARLAGVAAPTVSRRRRPKIALLTPLPPDRSGVADYTAASCEDLGRLTELHVFTETERPARLPGAVTVRPLSAIPSASAGFDRVVNVLGNSHFHLQIFHQLLRYGGACIGHDSRMLGFYRIMLGMDRATLLATRELGRPVKPDDIDRWIKDEDSLEALHYGEIVAAADPMVVHSPLTARLMHERYGVEPALLPFCIYRPWHAEDLAQRAVARRRLGLSDDEVVIVTFGFVDKTKAPLECIWALEILRGWDVNASMHFVGANAGLHELNHAAAELGLADKVVFRGEFVSDQTYRDYLVAADLGVQLRLTYLGSLSGALLDCIAAGLPTVTNASLAEMMDAPSYVRRVPDKISPLLVAEALADLVDEGVARTCTESARQAYSEVHSFRVYAERLCAALELDIEA
jgi:glycosyltransferase involved in cell wall biosynthesis